MTIDPPGEALVIDASAILTVLLAQSNAPDVAVRISERILFAPDLIEYETANGLLMATRQKRLDARELKERWNMLEEYDVRRLPISLFRNEALRAAQKHGLTLYDGTYLGLAIHLDLPLFTLDRALQRAAVAERLAATP